VLKGGGNKRTNEKKSICETTLGENTKDPTIHWDSERIGRED